MDNNIIDKRTQGEWITQPRNNSIFIEAIGEDNGETYAVEVCKLHGNETIDKEDAAFICKAVNNYDSLLEAFKRIADAYDNVEDLAGVIAREMLDKNK